MSRSDNEFSPYLNTVEWLTKFNHDFWYQPETTSTNSIAKAEATKLGAVKYFITNHQTEGRGRGKNTWTDQPGSQLLLTAAIPMDTAPPIWTTLIAGLVLYESINFAFGLTASIKAPNDIIVSGHKLAGILAEVTSAGTSHCLILGIGLNVLGYPLEFPATCLVKEVGKVGTVRSCWSKFLDQTTKQLVLLPHFCNAPLIELEQKLVNARLFHPEYGTFLNFVPDNQLAFKDKVISWRDL